MSFIHLVHALRWSQLKLFKLAPEMAHLGRLLQGVAAALSESQTTRCQSRSKNKQTLLILRMNRVMLVP